MFKRKKIPAPIAPRSLDDIKKAYADAMSGLANSQYQAKVYQEQADKWLNEMRSLNEEAAVRNKLDAEIKQQEAKRGS